MSEGFVYIFSNPSIPESLKIGRTSRDPQTRAKELSGTNIPTPYKVEHSRKFEDSISIEKTVHETLQDYRVSKDREFFNTSLYLASKVIDDLYIQELETKIKECQEKVQMNALCLLRQIDTLEKENKNKMPRKEATLPDENVKETAISFDKTCDRLLSDQKFVTNNPSQKKRGRPKGSQNKNPASGHIHPRKDSKNWIYQYWDCSVGKKRSLSVHYDKVAQVQVALENGQSVDEIRKIINGTRE